MALCYNTPDDRRLRTLGQRGWAEARALREICVGATLFAGDVAALQIRRGRKYDAIILDPPTFGRGAGGEMYKIERDLKDTLGLVKDLLSESPSFVLFSSHTPGLSQIVAENILGQLFPSAKLESGEMLLEPSVQSNNQTIKQSQIKQSTGSFPCPSGIYCRAVFG